MDKINNLEKEKDTPVSPFELERSGHFPLLVNEVRFCVGKPSALSSNYVKIWTHRGSVYAAMDGLHNSKVSLHPEQWRMAFTSDSSIEMTPGNRTWEVWAPPVGFVDGIVAAFRFYFLTSELFVLPKDRVTNSWKKVVFIEEGPLEKMSVVTVFVTDYQVRIQADHKRSFRFASLDIGNGKFAQIVAHAENSNEMETNVRRNIENVRKSVISAASQIHSDAPCHFFGNCADGARYLVCALSRARKSF
jgi:hypothetical protein